MAQDKPIICFPASPSSFCTFRNLSMTPSKITGLLIHFLQKQLLCHNRLASYHHFKWLNSSFKWLNICQASETWDFVIIQCSPLILAILPLLLFTFSSSNDKNLPNLQCSHSITSQLCKGGKKKKIKSPSALRMYIEPNAQVSPIFFLHMPWAICILTLRI